MNIWFETPRERIDPVRKEIDLTGRVSQDYPESNSSRGIWYPPQSLRVFFYGPKKDFSEQFSLVVQKYTSQTLKHKSFRHKNGNKWTHRYDLLLPAYRAEVFKKEVSSLPNFKSARISELADEVLAFLEGKE